MTLDSGCDVLPLWLPQLPHDFPHDPPPIDQVCVIHHLFIDGFSWIRTSTVLPCRLHSLQCNYLLRSISSYFYQPSPLASPVQQHQIVLSPTSSNRNLVMRPTPCQASSSNTLPVSCLSRTMSQTATALKRKRRQDDNSTVFAPIIKTKRKCLPQCYPQPSSSDALPAVNVVTINPTVRGIVESARVLLSSTQSSSSSLKSTQNDSNSGILSFPTETVYTLCCGISIPPRNCNTHDVSDECAPMSVLDQCE